MKIVDLLNYAEYFNMIGLLLLTAALVIFTAMLWYETRKTRLQNATPQISVYFFSITKNIMGMKIENTSHVDAKDVKVICLNNNKHNDGPNSFIYSEKLSKEIHYLPPNQAYSFLVGRFQVMKKESFSFDVSFNNVTGKIKTIYRINIDMDVLQRMVIEIDPEKEIATNLENIYNEFSAYHRNNIMNRCGGFYQQKTE